MGDLVIKNHFQGIVKKEDLPPSLLPSQIKIIEDAYNSEKIIRLYESGDSGKKQITQVISVALESERLINGVDQKLEPEQKILLLANIAKVVIQYRWMTIQELTTILNNGLTGMYVDDFNKLPLLNAKNVRSWIQKYYETQRKKALHIHQEHKKTLIKGKSMTKEEIEKSREKALNVLIVKVNSIKHLINKSTDPSTLPLLDYGNIYYNYLNKSKVINPSDREKINLFNTVKSETRLRDFRDQKHKENYCIGESKKRLFNQWVINCIIEGVDIKKTIIDSYGK